MGARIEAVARALEQHFRHIQSVHMADVPILNPALQVRAVGFHETDKGWLGVLITPWLISLVLVPRAQDAWRDLPTGHNHICCFPSGVYAFTLSEGEDIGRFGTCSLLSPVLEIDGQSTAVELALAALEALDDVRLRDGEASTHAAEVERRWRGGSTGQPPNEDEAQVHKSLPSRADNETLSRRDFLRGRPRGEPVRTRR